MRLDEFAGFTDLDSSLLLVSSQDPNADVGVHDGLDGSGDALLQLVLDGRGAKVSQVTLHLVEQLVELLLLLRVD